MEATINGGAVLTAKLQAFLFLVGPAVQDLVGYAARQKCRFGSGSEEKVTRIARIPIALGGACGDLRVCLIPNVDTPLLISKGDLIALDAIISTWTMELNG